MKHDETKNTIKQILIDGFGWINKKDGLIEVFTKNGEMAPVQWYRQGVCEYNGKYVMIVEYE